MNLVNILVDGLRAAIGPEAVVYALAAIGLNLHFGFTGLLNFGQVGFMLVGAYGVAITARDCAGEAATQAASQIAGPCGQSLWLGILVGIGLAVLLALALGVPTLRLRADYLAITTIAAAEILRFVFRSDWARPVTNSVFGIQRFADEFYAPNPIPAGRYLGQLNFSERQLWVMLVGWVLVALLTLWTYRLINSPWGRVLRSIREDEDAARSLGKNVFAYKMQALVVGGIIGAVAGFVFALSRANVQPDTFSTDFTFYFYVVLILGGAARLFGPVLGAAIFWFLYNLLSQTLNQAIRAEIIPPGTLSSTQVGPLVFFLLGLGMVLLLIFRPQGILGNRRELMLDVR